MRNTFFIRFPADAQPSRVNPFNDPSPSKQKYHCRTANPDHYAEPSNITFTCRMYASGGMTTQLNERNYEVIPGREFSGDRDAYEDHENHKFIVRMYADGRLETFVNEKNFRQKPGRTWDGSR